MSGKPWTHEETVNVRFPSKSFAISNPAIPDPLPNGPIFLVDTVMCTMRISRMDSSRDGRIDARES
jgi:hypothetical protein